MPQAFSNMMTPVLALVHEPDYFDVMSAQRDILLQVSGHTHGGQINPVGPLLPAMIPYLKGLYQVGAAGEKQLYVNRGFGTAGPPGTHGLAARDHQNRARFGLTRRRTFVVRVPPPSVTTVGCRSPAGI